MTLFKCSDYERNPGNCQKHEKDEERKWLKAGATGQYNLREIFQLVNSRMTKSPLKKDNINSNIKMYKIFYKIPGGYSLHLRYNPW